MYTLGVIFFGIALIPGVYLVLEAWRVSVGSLLLTRCFLLGLALAAGFFLFGLTLVVLVGSTRSILRLRLKEGNHKIFSPEATTWAFISSLYLLVNFTFIHFILLTPFANLLLRLLGAKLGKNVQINSKFIFDATLLEIGDNSVIGGGAVIIGHQVERGYLKLRKVKIGKKVTIGSNAIIAPGCEIGDNSIVGAGAVLLKNTKVPAREVWYGVPAAPVKQRREKEVEDVG